MKGPGTIDALLYNICFDGNVNNALFCPYTQVADDNHNDDIKDVKDGEGNGLIEVDLQRSKDKSDDNMQHVT